MTRQVDVKALVSHVIRGDGVNKCRICMGDTSEGQVHLSDTVIMEGDKSVTLSELLEVVTGIQVPLNGDLPAGLCVECSANAVNAANFRAMCRETSSKWHMTLQLLCNLPSQFSEKDKIMFVIMDDNQMILVIDEDNLKLDTASERLGTHLSTQINMNSLIDVKSDGKDESNDYNDILDKRESNESEIKEFTENKTLVARRVKTGDGVPKRDKNEILDSSIVEKEESEIKCNENEEPEMKRGSRRESEIKNVKDKILVTKKEESEQKYLIKTEKRLSIQMLQCPNCNKKFLNPLKLYHHLRGSIDMTRACHICCEIMTRDELVAHLNEVHSIEGFDCKKCPAILLTKNKFIQHLNKAHAHGDCSCIDCGQTFQSHQAFNAHMAVHRRKSCPSCDKIFQNQTCYLYHVKRCCNLDKNIKTKMRVDVKNMNSKRNIKVGVRGSTDNVCICDYCGKRFAKKKYVTAHIQIVHMKNTHAPCAYCGKLLATAHMTEHLKKHELNLSFKCQYCGIVLKSKLGYVQHLRLHTGERPYACKICKETFSASSRRSEHMRKIHQDTNVIPKHACKLCPAKFRLPYRLKKHMKSAHINESDEAQTFECTECHEKFGSCRGLLHHSRTHQKVLAETYLPGGLCSKCTDNALIAWKFKLLCSSSDQEWNRATKILTEYSENPFMKLDNSVYYICLNKEGTIFKGSALKIHTLKEATDKLNDIILKSDIERENILNKPPKYRLKTKCQQCGKAFNQPQYLNQHLMSTPKGACTICGKILPKEKLATHLENVHEKFVHACKICYQLFDHQSSLDTHNELHGIDSPQCRVCKHGFKNERSLRAHMFAHTLFNCSKCGRSFENRKCYVYHRDHCKHTRHNTEVEGTYECHDCGRKYSKKPSLRIHVIQKHLDVLPFVCQICGKRSSTKYHHKAHEIVHETERKVYQCECGAKMRTVTGFLMHQRIHTGEKPYKCEECGDSFLSSSRRLDHIKRRHRGGHLHNCEKCGAGFIRPFELKKHIQSAHSEMNNKVK